MYIYMYIYITPLFNCQWKPVFTQGQFNGLPTEKVYGVGGWGVVSLGHKCSETR